MSVSVGELRALASEHRARGNRQTARALTEAAKEIEKQRLYVFHSVRYELCSFGEWVPREERPLTRRWALFHAAHFRRHPDRYRNVRVMRVYRRAKR